MPTPLLEQEDDEGDNEARPVALPKESLLQAEVRPGLLLLADGSFDFGELDDDRLVVDLFLAQVCDVGECLLFAANLN